MKTALITGTSSGLGHGLADYLLNHDWAVYGCSRRGCDLPGVHDCRCDLTDATAIPPAFEALLRDTTGLDLVVLNAGILGQVRDLTDTLADLKQVMETNVWANKSVMDWLHAWGKPIRQIIMISSGAAVFGNRGWNGYGLSKATLNMLAKLYSHEFPDTHICALAPGIVDTPLMDLLCDESDSQSFPALKRLQAARGSDAMPTPLVAAEQIVSVLPELVTRPSGSFVDIREILDPQGYARLYGSNS